MRELPPRLNATSLLLWGAGLLVAGIVGSALISSNVGGHESEIAAQFWSVSVGALSTIATLANLLGVGFITAAFIVRALEKDSK
jgi:hypothetical protein